jgi:hypothetical protein
VPGLRGPRALEELATLLISTGELTADDLRRLPARDRLIQKLPAQQLVKTRVRGAQLPGLGVPL